MPGTACFTAAAPVKTLHLYTYKRSGYIPFFRIQPDLYFDFYILLNHFLLKLSFRPLISFLYLSFLSMFLFAVSLISDPLMPADLLYNPVISI